MKIVQINTFNYKSTGHIMMNIHKILTEQGYDSYVCWGRGRPANNNHEIVISDNIGVKFYGMYTRLLDKTGFASRRATKKLLRRLDEIKPDIIHLHNIHGYYLNIELLFNYIREHNISVVWTLHDCWPLTGHCAGFDMCGCKKWKTGCFNCEQLGTYPASKGLDNSKWNWNKKKDLFTNLNLIIVTPSQWLRDNVMKSYLRDYRCEVINNGIDLNIFKSADKCEIKKAQKEYNLDARKIVLGVASEWTPKKGLFDFIKLSEMMQDIQFVVVGLTERQIKEMPQNIKGIKRTENQRELAALYTIADVFFNPTYEDNFPTTNLEALACGTPVITYDTGGSPESLDVKEKNLSISIGEVIEKTSPASVSYETVKARIYSFLKKNKNDIQSQVCRNAAMEYSAKKQFEKYTELYGEIIRKES